MAGYKRSVFVINPKFQFKFSFIVCTLILVSSLLYPLTIYELFEKFFEANPATSEQLRATRFNLLMTLSVIQILFLAVVFVICIFVSHKIAGPMYKLSNFFKNIADGNKPEELYFRSGDNFQEIADDYNHAMERIISDRANDFTYIGEVRSYIDNLTLVVPEDKKPVIKEITTKLAEIQNKYNSVE